MQGADKVIRVGNSMMTPSQFILDVWAKVRKFCPDIKFHIVPFENTPENAREILAKFGTNIDIVSGWFDEAFLDYRGCAALKLANDPICCSLSINHRLAFREKLKITDLYGETVMLIKRGWNKYTDAICDELWSEHTQIKIIDISFFNAEVFNKCESENNILIDFGNGGTVHPLLKRVPIDWDYTIPFGILHSPKPSETVSEFLEAVSKVILAVGGGSVMDCCKAVSLAAVYDGDIWEDYWEKSGVVYFETIPLGVIVTVREQAVNVTAVR